MHENMGIFTANSKSSADSRALCRVRGRTGPVTGIAGMVGVWRSSLQRASDYARELSATEPMHASVAPKWTGHTWILKECRVYGCSRFRTSIARRRPSAASHPENDWGRCPPGACQMVLGARTKSNSTSKYGPGNPTSAARAGSSTVLNSAMRLSFTPKTASDSM